jgi:diketogulonate reductase-like aldo/keto reductase
VLLKWSAVSGAVPITTSAQEKRQKEQFEYNISAWELGTQEVEEINSVGATAPFRKYWTHIPADQWDN